MSLTIRNKRKVEMVLEELRGAVWDLDNTLYRSDALIEKSFNIAVAKAAIAAGVPMDMEEAYALSRWSWDNHGFSGHVFVNEYGLCRKALHFNFHSYIDEKMVARSEEIRTLFDEVDLSHALITHSHRSWAERVLEHLGLKNWFPEGHVMGLEDYDFRHKHSCTTPFDRALSCLGVAPAQAVMIEDMIPNLRIPHGMGMMTVYLHHGRPHDDLPDFVDIACNSAREFLEIVRKES